MPSVAELQVKHGSRFSPRPESYTYYRYLVGAVRTLEPMQVVELGGNNGLSAHYMLNHMPDNSKLYSVDIIDGWFELKATPPQRNDAYMLVGDTRDMGMWQDAGVDLTKTDLWFFDSDHKYEQLTEEWRLYSPFFKPGAVALLDDILLNVGMHKAWGEITHEKLEVPEIHFSGFGLVAA
jgi:predicted O-methyltransferase YrrM